LVIEKARTSAEIEMAFSILVEQRIGAFLAGADTLFASQGRQLAGLAERHTIPAIYTGRYVVEAGGLMSYGTSFDDAFRLAGAYAGRILKGEKPSDLPVQQSTKIELVINLRTAKALGVAVPPTLFALTEGVIE
jgi:ABC-type uncharacterized transport system substrate-binding protein